MRYFSTSRNFMSFYVADTKCRPLSMNSILVVGWVSLGEIETSLFFSKSQKRMNLSWCPVAIDISAGFKARAEIACSFCFKFAMFFPAEASHILMVASAAPEATTPPSGEMSTHVMGFPWDFRVCELFFCLKSQIFTFVSSEPETKITPFLEF